MSKHDDNYQDDAERREESELTDAGREALKRLQKDRQPNPAMEKRLIGLLKERGYIKQKRRLVMEINVSRIAIAIAACLILLATGFVIGQWTGSQQSENIDPFLQASDDFTLAATVQQKGSAYVIALNKLANISTPGDSDLTSQGQEVAITTLCTAAGEISRLVPKDVLKGQLLATLDTGVDNGNFNESSSVAIKKDQIIEF